MTTAVTAIRNDLATSLSVLRDGLLAASPSQDGGVRQQIMELAETSPQNFDRWWRAGWSVTDGPVDVIDFFSGCGGMSAGFRAINGVSAAFRHILAVDIDAVANETYERNLQLSPALADVNLLRRRKKHLEALVRDAGRRQDNPLVVIGCAPCQGFSSHRNQSELPDARNDLFEDFALIAVQLDADFIVIENVPELCTDRHWPRVERVRSTLEKAGYRVHIAVHNFAEFGLPQERFRAVMLAARQNFEPPEGFVPRSEFRTVRDVIGKLPAVQPGIAHSLDPLHQSAGHRASTIEMIKSVPKDGGRRRFDTGPASLRALQLRQGKPGYEDVYGRLYWDRPAITITHYARNPASGRFVHPEQDRGLTGREAALLQGFPRDYDFAGGFDDKFRQIGNAVPPLVAAHLALTILAQVLDPPSSGPGLGIEGPLAKSVARLIPALKARKVPGASAGRQA
jgi:DNA (cytosine-5)-methyltransferase 1